MTDINKDYKSIKIPHGREETPKNLHDHLKWKGKYNANTLFCHINTKTAAENRQFALHLSLPLLGRYFTGEKLKYLLHWICLVDAIRIFSMEKISAADMRKAEILLEIFVIQVEALYGPEFSDLEVHLLLHLSLQGIYTCIISTLFNFYNSAEIWSTLDT